ncbi:MAG: XrtA/PEP-CTERM system histidine kinase PrsK [Gammaproteobacteria bacterium]
MGNQIMSIGAPYLAAALSSLLLGAYVVFLGAGRILRIHFLCVALAGAIWSVFAGVAIGNTAIPDAAYFLAEIILLLAWYVFLERLLRGPYLQSMPELVRRGIRWAWLMVVLAGMAVVLAVPGVDSVVPAVEFYKICILLLSLLAMAMAAQLRADATIEGQDSLVAVCAAAMLISGLQGFMAAVSLLSGGLPAWFTPLRALSVLLASLLLFYAVSRRPQWSLAVFVSPQARVYVPKLSAVGVYFILILVVAPLFRSEDIPTAQYWGGGVILVAGLMLFIVLFSERLRAQLRVFVSKHFLPFRYNYREEWLRLIDTLVSPDQELPLPERAIKSLAQIVGSPAGVLWINSPSDGPYHYMSAWNTKFWSEDTVARDDPVVRFMQDRHWILDTAEINRKPELYPGLRRPDWLEEFPDALLIVPLISNELVIGFVVLFQSSSAFRLTFEEIDLLRTSGRQVAAHLAQYLADQQLGEAKQFEAFNRLTAFVMHDLKNLIAQQSLMVRNATKHKDNPAFFEDAIATIENSVARMNKLLQQLQTGESAGAQRDVSLLSAARDAAEKCGGRNPPPAVDEASDDINVHIDADRLVSVLSHLVRNAQDATSGSGTVTLGVQANGSHGQIFIEDDGCGMNSEFIRTRLFRPFDSTKGSQGMGIGAYQARSFILGAGGTMDVESEPDKGTRIRICLPQSEPNEG